MTKLLLQSDDFGLTYGIVDGTIKAVEEGYLKNVGLFVNMDSSKYASERIKGLDVCLGIDINLVTGKPISCVDSVPGLVDNEGYFKKSTEILSTNKVNSQKKHLFYFEVDPFPYKEVLLETENQIKKFIELIGEKPKYINSHSISTPNSEKAAKVMSKKYGIPHLSSSLYFNEKFIDLNEGCRRNEIDISDYFGKQSVELLLSEVFPKMNKASINYYVFHCGYIDADLFSRTSLTLHRMNDTFCLSDARIKKYIDENNIQLIRYDDL